MQRDQTKAGVLLAISAYSMWGFAPMYFKLLQSMPALEILLHRIVWSVVVLFALILVLRHHHKVLSALKNKKVVTTLLLSGLLLAGNWLLFIWAVNNDHLLDASLGYYINPLLNVLLGYLFLGERLRKLQQVAVVMATIGVAFLVISVGRLPWIALVLAGSFGVYGLMRKKVAVESIPGLYVESLMMLPFAIWFWWAMASPASNMLNNNSEMNLILIAAGVVTTAPLLCFTAAARRIQYSTLGFFQYIGPSIMFLLAVFLYGEPLDENRLITFGFVWSALILFSFDSWRAYQIKNRPVHRELVKD
ncbi:EamA family transporter RarD [Planctobacterium marinum]|uniref:EamA family transporter RarD n=1 Tax=Planctobacterium marinum TaxID=1631968 RepID=UPI001E316623|nr:EamA family transporter RarD [Planctobacterium marinum]MCC2607044.1 EamA family transporter RarD [Planctobacterium marinum]